MGKKLLNTRDIAMKLGMKMLNRIIVVLAKLQTFIFYVKKSYLRKTSRGSGIRPPGGNRVKQESRQKGCVVET